MAKETLKSRFLVFHIGHLGDSIMMLPAMSALRDVCGAAEFTLLYDKVVGEKQVNAQQIFANTDYFDRYIPFPKSRRVKKVFQALSLLYIFLRLRWQKFDTLVYLVPSNRSLKQVKRDRIFFNLAGIHHFIGMADFFKTSASTIVHETDFLLARLKTDGVPVPEPGFAEFNFQIQDAERLDVDEWFAAHRQICGKNLFVAFAPGSKMQSKRWSLGKFAQVGKKLIQKYDITPIVFGSLEDSELGNTLIKSWQRGLNAAGTLNIRQAAEALRRCVLYIGNDTGTMHMAASMRTPCVAIFSARDNEGKWYPYGHGHIVFRQHIHCQGCMLEFCDHKSCLKNISSLAVFRAIERNFDDIFKTHNHD